MKNTREKTKESEETQQVATQQRSILEMMVSNIEEHQERSNLERDTEREAYLSQLISVWSKDGTLGRAISLEAIPLTAEPNREKGFVRERERERGIEE